MYAIKIPFGYETMHLDTCARRSTTTSSRYTRMYDELHAYRLRKGDNAGEVAVDELDGSLKDILQMATASMTSC